MRQLFLYLPKTGDRRCRHDVERGHGRQINARPQLNFGIAPARCYHPSASDQPEREHLHGAGVRVLDGL